jgi:hypothetical protein
MLFVGSKNISLNAATFPTGGVDGTGVDLGNADGFFIEYSVTAWHGSETGCTLRVEFSDDDSTYVGLCESSGYGGSIAEYGGLITKGSTPNAAVVIARSYGAELGIPRAKRYARLTATAATQDTLNTISAWIVPFSYRMT